jgi:hypothetical protein
LLLSTTLLGCTSYAQRIDMDPPISLNSANRTELSELVAVVVGVAERSGLREDPELDQIRRQSAESRESKYRIVTTYMLGRVSMTVGVEKTTGHANVLVRDHYATAPTELTRSLEVDLRSALEAEFPGRRLEVTRQTVGPELGP